MFASTESRLTGQFVAEMRGIEELNGVTVLATTNRLDLVDKSLLVPGMFDIKIELPLPDEKARAEIFRILLRNKPLADDVDILSLAEKTEGLTGGDLSLICRRAAMSALKDNAENFVMSREHFADAVRTLKND